MAMGSPAKWYGALVGKQNGDGYELGFDDGECRLVSIEKLQELHDNQTLAAATPAEGGIVANQLGGAMASEFVTHSDGGKLKTIGLLVGAGTGAKGSLAGVPIHESFFVCPGMFAPPKRVRRKTAELSLQDRLGKSRTPTRTLCTMSGRAKRARLDSLIWQGCTPLGEATWSSTRVSTTWRRVSTLLALSSTAACTLHRCQTTSSCASSSCSTTPRPT